jgi:hypothetical protein
MEGIKGKGEQRYENIMERTESRNNKEENRRPEAEARENREGEQHMGEQRAEATQREIRG